MRRLHLTLMLVMLAIAACGAPADALPAEPTPAEPEYEEGNIEVADGLGLNYRSYGAGEQTLILLHGGPAMNFMGVGPDLVPLADDYRLIMYDQRGGGHSDPDPDASDQLPVTHVEDLERVREFFGLEKMTLMGHSWGCLVASVYTSRYPDRVERLVLLGPMEPSQKLLDARHAVSQAIADEAAAEVERRLAEAGEIDGVERCRIEIETMQEFYYHNPAKMRTVRKGDYCAVPADSRERGKVIEEAIMAALAGYDLQPMLATLEVPALVVEGARTPLPKEGNVAWARALPNSRIWWVDNVGHAYPFVEAPDVFFPGLRVFLNGGWPEGSEAVSAP